MEYLPGMEQIQSDICARVMEQMHAYDYSKYTTPAYLLETDLDNVEEDNNTKIKMSFTLT